MVLFDAEFSSQPVQSRLSVYQHHGWVVLADALEVHRVVYLIFAAEHLFEREVVMPFLQRIERYLFVVFGESVPGPSCACSGASIV